MFNSSMNSIYDTTEQLEYAENKMSTQEIDAFNNGISDFNQARSQLKTKHMYYVELHYSEDTYLVDAIYVYYYEPMQEFNGSMYVLLSLDLDYYVYNMDVTNTELY